MKRMITESFPIDILSEFHMPKAYDYCASCEHFGKIETCPSSYNDNSEILSSYLSSYATFKLVIYESEYNMDNYINFRLPIDDDLLRMEDDKTLSLYPGRCVQCNPCSMQMGFKCPYPQKKRYSLESIGLDVSGLYEKLIDRKLEWNDKKLTYIAAILVRE